MFVPNKCKPTVLICAMETAKLSRIVAPSSANLRPGAEDKSGKFIKIKMPRLMLSERESREILRLLIIAVAFVSPENRSIKPPV